ncbi:MAG: TetR/AcrR family transcriptional regulator [Polymorphobacter sp.]
MRSPFPAARPNARGRPADAVKRAAIFAAAQTLFIENGYGATSMERIADAANVSKLTVYRHFHSKDALFAAAVASKCRTMLNELGDFATRQRDVQATLEAAGAAFLGLILHPDAFAMHQIVVSERQRSPELGRLFFDNAIALTQAQVAALIEALVQRGELSGLPADVATDFLALLRHRPILALEFGQETLAGADRQAHIARCVSVIRRAYAPADGPHRS